MPINRQIDYENGLVRDGISYRIWHRNGERNIEIDYAGGAPLRRRTWNEEATVLYEETFNKTTQRFVKEEGHWEHTSMAMKRPDERQKTEQEKPPVSKYKQQKSS